MDEAKHVVKRYLSRLGIIARQKGWTKEEKKEAKRVLLYILNLFEVQKNAPPLILLASYRDRLLPAIGRVTTFSTYWRVAKEIVDDVEKTLIK